MSNCYKCPLLDDSYFLIDVYTSVCEIFDLMNLCKSCANMDAGAQVKIVLLLPMHTVIYILQPGRFVAVLIFETYHTHGEINSLLGPNTCIPLFPPWVLELLPNKIQK